MPVPTLPVCEKEGAAAGAGKTSTEEDMGRAPRKWRPSVPVPHTADLQYLRGFQVSDSTASFYRHTR